MVQGSDGYANNVTESSSPADNGTIAFSRLAGALHIWRIDHATDPRFTSTSKVTEDPATDISPYILHGRRWLAFSRGSETLHDIWVRDIQSGNESLFLASSIDKASPIVDDSSNAVVFEIRNNGSTLIFTGGSASQPGTKENAFEKGKPFTGAPIYSITRYLRLGDFFYQHLFHTDRLQVFLQAFQQVGELLPGFPVNQWEALRQ